ncbi:MAG: hypothetical protein HY319_06895 [Armatimonadetes bacterium]|nr:hypothetical protein [Armatimonadota bacterium]
MQSEPVRAILPCARPPKARLARAAAPADRFTPGSTDPIEEFRRLARGKLGALNPTRTEMGALLLWEASLGTTAAGPAVKPEAGALTGYLSALGASLGSSTGALAPALLDAARSFRPELLLRHQENNGFQYLDAGLSGNELLSMERQLGIGVGQYGGVTCAGLRTEGEARALDRALERLKERVPRLYPALKAVLTVTWLGSKQPDAPEAERCQGAFACGSPGILEIERAVLSRPARLEEVLFHEFGHLVDQDGMGFRSTRVNAFLSFREVRDCVSAYATTAPHEDFAETFAFCLKNFERIARCPDLFFYGLGPLSEKFRYVFEEVLEQQIPPPTPRWFDFKARLAAGESPFGWRAADGTIHQALADARDPLRQVALFWDLDHPEKELEYRPQNRSRQQLEFVAHQVLGLPGEPAYRPPPSLPELAQDLAELQALAPEHERAEQELKQNEERCQAYVQSDCPPSQIPVESSGYTGLLFGQKALALDGRLDELEKLPETSWKESVRGMDRLLDQKLQDCVAPDQVRSCLQARVDELMQLYEELSHRPGDQARDAIMARRNDPDYARLNSDLTGLLKNCRRHLEKNLRQHLEQEGRSDLLSTLQAQAVKAGVVQNVQIPGGKTG